MHTKQPKEVQNINLEKAYKEKCRAEMGYKLYKKHKTFEVSLAVGNSFLTTLVCFIITFGWSLNEKTIKYFKFWPSLYNFLEEVIVYGFVNQYMIIRKLEKKKNI